MKIGRATEYRNTSQLFIGDGVNLLKIVGARSLKWRRRRRRRECGLGEGYPLSSGPLERGYPGPRPQTPLQWPTGEGSEVWGPEKIFDFVFRNVKLLCTMESSL